MIKFKFIVACLSMLVFVFFTACHHKSKNVVEATTTDSINYYFKKINDSTLNDSVKLLFNHKVLQLNRELEPDSVRFNNYFDISSNYYALSDTKAYQEVSQKVVQEALSLKDTLKIAKAYTYLGETYLNVYELDSAFYYLDKAEVYYVRKDLYNKTNDIKLKKAVIQYRKSDFLGCEKSILLTLPYFKKSKDFFQLYTAYTLLGISKMETKEYDESLEALLLAKEYAERIDPTYGTFISAINNIAILYFKKGDYLKAIEYYNQLNNDQIKNDYLEAYTYTQQNIAYSKFKLGNIKDFEKEYQKVLQNFKELNIPPIYPKIQLSEFYETQNQVEKAQKNAMEAYEASLNKFFYREKLLALKQLTNVFPERAKEYSSAYIKLNDSIATIDKKAQNTFARMEYRVDELNTENLLLEQKNRLIIYYALTVLLLLSMFFVFRWQKQKQKEYFLIQEQQRANEEVYNLIINQQNELDFAREQEQRKISRELHDGVLGKLFGVRMNLDFLNNDDKASKKDRQHFINEIINVEKLIRQISHELSDETKNIVSNYQLMLDNFVDDQVRILGKAINYNVDPKVPWDMLTAKEKINLYRMVQETFQNINKYAKAKRIDFFVNFTENKLEISILDDGIGFDPQKVVKGIGIKNMKERAKIINATYEINAELHKGTQTRIVLDINPQKKNKTNGKFKI